MGRGLAKNPHPARLRSLPSPAGLGKCVFAGEGSCVFAGEGGLLSPAKGIDQLGRGRVRGLAKTLTRSLALASLSRWFR